MNMPSLTSKDDDTKSPPSSSVVFVMFGTLASTTWRLFVPTLGGTILGLWADNSWNTKPWLTITGVTAGTILSLALIYKQIGRVKS